MYCDLCSKDLNPKIDDFTMLDYRENFQINENMLISKPVTKNICLNCSDKFNETYSDVISCFECSKHCDTTEHDFVVKFVHFSYINIIVLCSKECYQETVDKAEKDEEFQLKNQCSCGVIKENMNKCEKCKKTFYCSQECQEKDRVEHQKICKDY